MKPQAWLLPVILVLAFAAKAEVYKWVDEQGNVHYGDLPPGGVQTEPVKLPGLSTYRSPAQDGQGQLGGTAADGPFTGYTRVEIIQPKANEVVRTNEQRMVVAVALEPPLQEGHAIQVWIDGSAVGAPYNGTAVELSGVYRGQHRLQVRVLDATGKVLAQSAVVTFTLRQAGLKPGPGEPPLDDGDGSKPGYDPAKDQGKDYIPPDGSPPYTPANGAPPYTPPAEPAGDYKPANGTPPHKPGSSAPGFAPRYNP